MYVSALVAQFRGLADDPEMPGAGNDQDSLWLTDEIISYLDKGQLEYAQRIEGFADSRTASVTLYTITANDPYITLSPLILAVTQATFNNRPLRQVPSDAVDDTAKAAIPYGYVLDDQEGVLRVYPIPTQGGALKLRVKRLPLYQLRSEGDAIEVPDRHTEGVLAWALHLAYSKPDVDSLNAKKAEYWMARALKVFDQAYTQRRQRMSSNRPVKYGGY